MAGLVGYSSSDDGSEEGTQPRTSKETRPGVGSASTDKEEALRKTKTEPPAPPPGSDGGPSAQHAEGPSLEAVRAPAASTSPAPHVVPSTKGAPEELLPAASQDAVLIGPSRPPPMAHAGSGGGGGAGPSAAAAYAGAEDVDIDDADDMASSVGGGSGSGDPPLSPYSAERAAVRQATLPRVADLDIPGSPRGTPPPSLDALGEKLDTFLALKRDKGVHFNARLAQSDAMKNPALMDKLLAFVGWGEGDDGEEDEGGGGGIAAQYTTTLPPSLWDPTALPAWAHRKPLRALQDEMAKRRARAPGEKVEFVPAGGAGSGPGSGTTPAPILGKRRPV